MVLLVAGLSSHQKNLTPNITPTRKKDPMAHQTVTVVVGAQCGSEGKGHVVHRVIREQATTGRTFNVRVAGPNAGHTVITDDGTALPLRTIPVGVATPNVALGIAAGSEIDLDVLRDEIKMCEDAGVTPINRLFIHEQATILEPEHHTIERDMQMHENIGSTAKGIGAARSARIMRTARIAADVIDELLTIGATVVPAEVWEASRRLYDNVIIEGTQGYDLGLHAGHYPHCTSSDTRAIDFMAMAGISPWSREVDNVRVLAVARVYPIRVAGNSGPIQNETTWEDLGLEPELTTVTRKVRRVGQFDMEQVVRAINGNGGPSPVVQIALTMVDQLDSNLAGSTTVDAIQASEPVHSLIRSIEDAGAKVALATTSPNTGVWL